MIEWQRVVEHEQFPLQKILGYACNAQFPAQWRSFEKELIEGDNEVLEESIDQQ